MASCCCKGAASTLSLVAEWHTMEQSFSTQHQAEPSLRYSNNVSAQTRDTGDQRKAVRELPGHRLRLELSSSQRVLSLNEGLGHNPYSWVWARSGPGQGRLPAPTKQTATGSKCATLILRTSWTYTGIPATTCTSASMLTGGLKKGYLGVKMGQPAKGSCQISHMPQVSCLQQPHKPQQQFLTINKTLAVGVAYRIGLQQCYNGLWHNALPIVTAECHDVARTAVIP